MSRKLIQGALLVAAVIWLPWVTWEVLKSYVLGQPDYKFGAEGAIWVVAVLKALTAVAAIAVWLAATVITSKVSPLSDRGFLFWTVAAAITLSILSQYLFYLPPLGTALFGDVGAIVATWVALCVIVFVAFYLVVGASSKLTTP